MCTAVCCSSFFKWPIETCIAYSIFAVVQTPLVFSLRYAALFSEHFLLLATASPLLWCEYVMALAVTYMLSVFNVADLNSQCGKRNCSCGTLVHDFQMGVLLATVIPRESLSLPVVLSYRCRSVCEICKNRKGNDNIWRYSVAVIASCATITQPLASCLKTCISFYFSLPGDVLQRCRTIFAELPPTRKIVKLFPQPTGVLERVVLHLGFIWELVTPLLGQRHLPSCQWYCKLHCVNFSSRARVTLWCSCALAH